MLNKPDEGNKFDSLKDGIVDFFVYGGRWCG